MGVLGFVVTALSIALSVIPPGEEPHKLLFELKLVGATVGAMLVGLILHWSSRQEKTEIVRST
jgi:hypothetical protein